jgi:hypothetical protein
VVIVINGTKARLDVPARKVFADLRGSISDVVLNNVLFVFTNCDQPERNFDLESLAVDLPGAATNADTCYHMQNLTFSTDPRK